MYLERQRGTNLVEDIHELLNTLRSESDRPVISSRAKKLDPERIERVAMYRERYDNCIDLFTGKECEDAVADRQRIDGFDISYLKEKAKQHESATSSGAYRMGN
jgi:hypothetical protein